MARLVFFGNERIATGVSTTTPTLNALLKAGHEIAAVVCSYEKGTSRNARELEIQEVAEAHGIPVLLPTKPAEIIEQLKAYQAEVGVLVAYGRIIPQSIIDIFPKGIVNIHPSLLPKHRGPIPIESVILGGETKTGVSVMSLVKAMDAGPVYGQSEITLDGSESKQELADTLLEIGAKMVVELLPGILDGSIVALPQDDSGATYDQLLSKDAGLIDWDIPAKQIEREVRALLEWPKSYTELAGKEVIITKAHVADGSAEPGVAVVEGKELLIGTASKMLAVDMLKPAGKGEMTAEGFLAGYGNLLTDK